MRLHAFSIALILLLLAGKRVPRARNNVTPPLTIRPRTSHWSSLLSTEFSVTDEGKSEGLQIATATFQLPTDYDAFSPSQRAILHGLYRLPSPSLLYAVPLDAYPPERARIPAIIWAPGLQQAEAEIPTYFDVRLNDFTMPEDVVYA